MRSACRGHREQLTARNRVRGLRRAEAAGPFVVLPLLGSASLGGAGLSAQSRRGAAMNRGGRQPGAWERGMWDPLEKNPIRQWWESTDHLREFVNAIRAVLGKDPIPDTEGHRS